MVMGAAFTEAKRQLSSQQLLVHFDPSKKLLLSCNASPYGIGAVLSHLIPDGTEQPIAFTHIPCQRLSKLCPLG